MKSGLLTIIDRIPDVSVLVVGDTMMDISDYCLTSESKVLHSEKPGKRAYRSQRAVKALGGAGNVAANLASLGVKTTLIGVVGNDESYFQIRDLCEAQGIRHVLIRDPSRPTTTKNRLFVDGEYLLRRDDESTEDIDRETEVVLVKEVLRHLPQVQVVVLSDYDKGVFTEFLAQELIREARLSGVPVVVDFKPPNSHYFMGADVIAPNEHEARELLPAFSLVALRESTIALHRTLGCKSLVVTLGEKGLCGYDGRNFFHIEAHKVAVLDAVGCGDTVRAGIALGQALRISLHDSCELANYAAAVAVQKPNTSSVTANELKAFIQYTDIDNTTENKDTKDTVAK